MVGGLTTRTTGIVLDVARQRGGAMPGIVTLHDHSRMGNDGVMTNVTWTQLPSGLWVPVFNGISAFVNCGDDESLEFGTNDFSTELWVWADASQVAYATVIDKDHSAAPNHGWFWGFDLATVYMTFGLGGGAEYSVASITMEIKGAWHHLVSRYDYSASEVRLYVDGVFNIGTPHATGVDPSGNLSIGRWTAGTRWFNGYIALVRLYTYALTPGQILQRFEATRRLFGV